MIDRASILAQLDHAPVGSFVERLRVLLRREDTRLISDRVAKVTVSEARRLWSTRLGNTRITGQHLDGAESLLASLSTLSPQKKLEQFAFKGPEESGNLFFEAVSRRFVGAILFATLDQRKSA